MIYVVVKQNIFSLMGEYTKYFIFHKGEYRDNKCNGKGKFTFKNGDIYEVY